MIRLDVDKSQGKLRTNAKETMQTFSGPYNPSVWATRPSCLSLPSRDTEEEM